jgi:hypothetical protein
MMHQAEGTLLPSSPPSWISLNNMNKADLVATINSEDGFNNKVENEVGKHNV